jgi:hypothetical protein
MFFRYVPAQDASLSYDLGFTGNGRPRPGSACGAGPSGKPCSSIGFDRRWNRMRSLMRGAFVDEQVAAIPPRPAPSGAMRSKILVARGRR